MGEKVEICISLLIDIEKETNISDIIKEWINEGWINYSTSEYEIDKITGFKLGGIFE